MAASNLLRVIAARIASARARVRLTQAELAELAGVTDETISRLERGRYEPAVSTLVAVARALGVSLDYLAGLDDRQPDSRYPVESAAHRFAEEAVGLDPTTARALLNLVRVMPRPPEAAGRGPARRKRR